jgi:hypothetical protein
MRERGNRLATFGNSLDKVVFHLSLRLVQRMRMTKAKGKVKYISFSAAELTHFAGVAFIRIALNAV